MEFTAEGRVPASNLRASSAPTHSNGILLLVGNDNGLQHSRRLLLERAGFSPVCLNSRQALAGEGPETCRMALICRSVGHREAQWIAHLLRALQPQLPILRFATGGEMASPEFSSMRRESASPPVLLAEVSRLLLP